MPLWRDLVKALSPKNEGAPKGTQTKGKNPIKSNTPTKGNTHVPVYDPELPVGGRPGQPVDLDESPTDDNTGIVAFGQGDVAQVFTDLPFAIVVTLGDRKPLPQDPLDPGVIKLPFGTKGVVRAAGPEFVWLDVSQTYPNLKLVKLHRRDLRNTTPVQNRRRWAQVTAPQLAYDVRVWHQVLEPEEYDAERDTLVVSGPLNHDDLVSLLYELALTVPPEGEDVDSYSAVMLARPGEPFELKGLKYRYVCRITQNDEPIDNVTRDNLFVEAQVNSTRSAQVSRKASQVETITLFHGSREPEITEFETSIAGARGYFGSGVYCTPEFDQAAYYGPYVYEMRFTGSIFDEIEPSEGTTGRRGDVSNFYFMLNGCRYQSWPEETQDDDEKAFIKSINDPHGVLTYAWDVSGALEEVAGWRAEPDSGVAVEELDRLERALRAFKPKPQVETFEIEHDEIGNEVAHAGYDAVLIPGLEMNQNHTEILVFDPAKLQIVKVHNTTQKVSRTAAKGPTKRQAEVAPEIPKKIVDRLTALASKYSDFKEFSRAWSSQGLRGQYWHLTSDPKFSIRDDYRPTDNAGGFQGGSVRAGWGGLMVTSWPAQWPHSTLGGGDRQYAAEIDLSALQPGADYSVVSRGFGHEIYVNAPLKARVVRILSRASAMKASSEWDRKGPHSENELKSIWDLVHPASSREDVQARQAMPMPVGLPEGWRVVTEDRLPKGKRKLKPGEVVLGLVRDYMIVDAEGAPQAVLGTTVVELDPVTWQFDTVKALTPGSGWGAYIQNHALREVTRAGGQAQPDDSLSESGQRFWSKLYDRVQGGDTKVTRTPLAEPRMIVRNVIDRPPEERAKFWSNVQMDDQGNFVKPLVDTPDVQARYRLLDAHQKAGPHQKEGAWGPALALALGLSGAPGGDGTGGSAQTPKVSDPAAFASRASKFQELVDTVARAEGVDPNVIHAMIRAESGYKHNQTSSKGAVGLMQTTPITAKQMGVPVPTTPHESASLGVRYLKYLLRMFRGDLELALAAYNRGPTAVKESLATKGRAPQTPETVNYVRRVFRELGRQPVHYAD